MRNYNENAENTKQLYVGLQSFFKKDVGIKEMISKLAPTEMEDYNEEKRFLIKLEKYFI